MASNQPVYPDTSLYASFPIYVCNCKVCQLGSRYIKLGVRGFVVASQNQSNGLNSHFLFRIKNNEVIY